MPNGSNTMARGTEIFVAVLSANLLAIANAFIVCYHFGILFWQPDDIDSTQQNTTLFNINSHFSRNSDRFAAFLCNVPDDCNGSNYMAD